MRYLILTAAVALAGCSAVTKPLPAEQAKPVPAARVKGFQHPPAGDYGTLLITRDSHAFSGADVKVTIGRQAAAELAQGETVKLYLPAGDSIIGATRSAVFDEPEAEAEVTLKPGQVKRYRLSIRGADGVIISPTAY
ncbi:hypothetical protein [Cupriavidus pinatubonensis]|uniref:hypothetical protein n=1 Tax=Cupriavidus pinatubonensis TaxID=248026 RepID=UPI00360D05FF